jgi:hypothetical protein
VRGSRGLEHKLSDDVERMVTGFLDYAADVVAVAFGIAEGATQRYYRLLQLAEPNLDPSRGRVFHALNVGCARPGGLVSRRTSLD